jgi:hypothetical protein
VPGRELQPLPVLKWKINRYHYALLFFRFIKGSEIFEKGRNGEWSGLLVLEGEVDFFSRSRLLFDLRFLYFI